VPLARYLALTTIEVRIAEIGARAVSRLIDMLDSRDADRSNELTTPELVARATTASAASA
jgi:LacI family transcriptional regulator